MIEHDWIIKEVNIELRNVILPSYDILLEGLHLIDLSNIFINKKKQPEIELDEDDFMQVDDIINRYKEYARTKIRIEKIKSIMRDTNDLRFPDIWNININDDYYPEMLDDIKQRMNSILK